MQSVRNGYTNSLSVDKDKDLTDTENAGGVECSEKRSHGSLNCTSCSLVEVVNQLKKCSRHFR